MNQIEKNIDLLYKYVDGDLNSTDALYVEKQLAENEEWQIVYEGLVFAEEEEIDIQATLNRLESRLASIEKKNKRESVIPLSLKRFLTAAAAIAGFVLLSYTALKIINSGLQQQESTAVLNDNNYRPDFYPEDQIQIISPKKSSRINQRFNPKEVEDFVAGHNEEFEIVEETTIQNEAPEIKAASPKKVDFVHLDSPLEAPGSYKTLLDRYGYREIRNPNLLNTTRGANGTEPPLDHFVRFKRNAMSGEMLKSFIENQEKNYIARFPFNGVVKAKILVDKDGNATKFTIIESETKDGEEIAKELLVNRAKWQVPLNRESKPMQQAVFATISFGNTISIKIDFEQ